MRISLFLIPFLILAQVPVKAPDGGPDKTPAGSSETLHYAVNWPSGLSLGEATLSATRGPQLEFSFVLDASIPGFAITERASSKATPGFCSTELEKSYVRGKRTSKETSVFEDLSVKRTTKDGGSSTVSAPHCAKDAVTFLHFLRKELAAGRLPPQQKVFYGAAYDTRVQFLGVEKVTIGGEPLEAEHIQLFIKGPSSESTAEIFFAKDPVRTPLILRAPFVLGRFSMELVR